MNWFTQTPKLDEIQHGPGEQFVCATFRFFAILGDSLR